MGCMKRLSSTKIINFVHLIYFWNSMRRQWKAINADTKKEMLQCLDKVYPIKQDLIQESNKVCFERKISGL